MASLRQDALDYHEQGRPGKIEVNSTKPFTTQRDLSLAYTPGVAEPCREIQADPEKAFAYTARGNLVGVITNGTAVLGLGNIGALAGKPVMEGKAVLFKRFADIDVFDIEIDTLDPEEFIQTVRLLEPTFGGINLEDIKAPECFEIEARLREEMGIPVFHDDQHGTAIISGAALLNALEITGKDIADVRVVYNGAGAAAVASARLHISLGVRPDHVIMCDSKGAIYKGRTVGMNPQKDEFAAETAARTLAEAIDNADVFLGLSVKDALTSDMLLSMADSPIVFALANPDPEIDYELARQTRADVLMATGRSDYANQVNNVLGFPFIFRGALDVRARSINEEMKVAAVRALADLAKEEVPNAVLRAYGVDQMAFGPDYIIPKPLDYRVLFRVAPAVARAAVDSGVAGITRDLDGYTVELEKRLGLSRDVIRTAIQKAKSDPRRIVFPEGEHEQILRAARVLVEEGIAVPVLLGSESIIRERMAALGVDLPGIAIEDPKQSPQRDEYVRELHNLRKRKGVTLSEAEQLVDNLNIFGSLMVNAGHADGLVSGLTYSYPDTIRPALQVIGTRDGVRHVSGLSIVIIRGRVCFFADTTVNIAPDAETLAEIALEAADLVQRLNIVPRVALLSFSNFGSAGHAASTRVRDAVNLVRNRRPNLVIDGEMQADTAVNPAVAQETFSFSAIQGDANVLVFPDLQSGNIAYKLLQGLGGAEIIGPILMGMRKSVHVLQRGSDVNTVVNMAAFAVLDAQDR